MVVWFTDSSVGLSWACLITEQFCGDTLHGLDNYSLFFFLSYHIYKVEALVMKLVICLDFNPDPVPNIGWYLLLFTKA